MAYRPPHQRSPRPTRQPRRRQRAEPLCSAVLTQIKLDRHGNTIAFATAGRTRVFVSPGVLSKHCDPRLLSPGETVDIVWISANRGAKAIWLRRAKSDRNWAAWQAGREALPLLETAPGSKHPELTFACWQCGVELVRPDDIYRLKAGGVWTKGELATLVARGEPFFNKVKGVEGQPMACRQCTEHVGVLYVTPWASARKVGQLFPAVKMSYTYDRHDAPHKRFNSVVIQASNKEDAQRVLKNLVPAPWSDGTGVTTAITQHTYELMEKVRQMTLQVNGRANPPRIPPSAGELARMYGVTSLEARAVLTEQGGDLSQANLQLHQLALKRREEELQKDAELKEAEFLVEQEKLLEEAEKEKGELMKQAEKAKEELLKEAEKERGELLLRLEDRAGIKESGLPPTWTAMGSKPIWEWRDEGDVWSRYTDVDSAALEFARKAGQVRAMVVASRYCVNLVKMQQKNCSTGYRRYVRRRTGKSPKAQENVCHLVDLQPGSSEYLDVAGRFTSGVHGKSIDAIKRVQMPVLWRMYAAYRDGAVAEMNEGDPNEKLLFHGTSADTMAKIQVGRWRMRTHSF